MIVERTATALRRLLLIVAIVAGLFALIVGLLHLAVVQQAIGEKALRAAGQVGLHSALEGLSFNLFTGTVHASRLVLRTSRDVPPWLDASNLDASVDIGKSIKGNPYAKAVSAGKVTLHLARGKDGAWNIPNGNQSSQPLDLVSLLPVTARADSIDIVIDDPTLKLRIEAPAIALALQSGRVRLQPVQPVKLLYGSFKEELRVAPLALTLGADSLDLAQTTITTSIGQAKLAGRSTSLSRSAYDGALEFSGDLPAALRMMGLQTRGISGEYLAALQIRGEKDSWEANVEASGKSVRIDPLPPLQVRLAASASSKQPSYTIRRFEAVSSEGNLSASGEVAAASSKTETRLQGEAEIADPPQFGKRFGLNVPVAALARTRWQLRFPAWNWRQAQGQAETELHPSSSIHAGLPLSADLRVELQTGVLAAEVRSLSLAGASSSGQVALNRADNTLEGSWTGTAPDLPAFLQALSVPAGVVPTVGRGNWSTRISGPVTEPAFDGDLAVSNVSAGAFTGLAAKSKATYTAGKLTLSDGGLTWAEQQAKFEGSFDFNPSSTEMRLDASSISLDIGAALIAAGVDAPLTGKASFNLHANGAASKPDARIDVKGTSFEFAGQPLGDLTVDAALHGGVLAVKPFRLSGPPAEGSGTYDLSSGRYSVALTAREWPLAPIPIAEKIALNGKLSLEIHGEGSLDQPSLDGSLRSPGLTAGEAATGPVEAALRLREKRMEAHVTAPGLGLEGTGELHLVAPFPANVALQWKSLNPARFGAPVTGSLDGSLTARLPLEHPRGGEGEVHFDKVQITAAGETLQNQAPIVAKLASEKLTLETARMTWREASFSLGGVLPGGLQLQGQMPLSIIAKLMPESGIVLQGTATLDGSVTGTYDKPQLQARIVSQDAAFEYPSSQWKGSLRAQADVTADGFSLEHIQSKIQIPELSFTARDLAFREVAPTSLTLEKGILRLDQVELQGPNTSVRAQGTINLLADNSLDLKVDGGFDLALLAPARSKVAFAGPAKAQVSIGGTWTAPLANGGLTLENGAAHLTEPPLEASSVNAELAFAQGEIELKQLSGMVNGGQLEAKGRLARKDNAGNVDVQINARSVYLDYPKGFKTVSSGQLTFRNDGEFYKLAGKVQVIDGGYREALTLGSLAPSAPVEHDATPSLLDRVRLDVAVSTLFPVAVDNNLAVAEMSANLRVIGTVNEPSVTGRLEVEPGGRIFALEQEFRVDHAAINFINENRIEPLLDVQATARVGQYDVVLRSSGGLDNLQNTFSSYPQLTEAQIEALLITGSPDNASKVATGSLAQRSAVSIFGSSLTGGVSSRLRRWTGVSEVRIEPGLVSQESNPSARLTVGQHLSEDLRIVYSSSLTESTDQIWFAEYDWRRRFQARVTRQDDATYRSEVRQLFEFGGGSRTGDPRRGMKRGKVRIGTVELQGDLLFPEEDIRKKLKLKPGSSYDFIKAQDKLDRLAKFYADRGYLESRIRAERSQGAASSVNLIVRVHPGLPVQLTYEGYQYPGSVRKKIAASWQDGIIDAQRTGTAIDEMRRHLFRHGYPDAKVTATVQMLDAKKRVVFETAPGDKVGKPSLVFEGVSTADASAIRTQLKGGSLEEEAITHPEPLRQAIHAYYLNHGYLAASVDAPVLRRSENGRPQTIVVVRPGQIFRVGKIEFEGVTAVDQKRLLGALPVAAGARYNPSDRPRWTRSILSEYWKDGYRDAFVRAELKPESDKSTLDVVFQVTENRRSVVAGVSVEGTYATSDKYVRDRVILREGEPADTNKLNQSRKNLIDSMAFNLVDVKAGAAKPDQAPPNLPAGTQPVWLDVTVREPKPYRLDLGAYYDTGRGTGFVADLSRTNLFGGARTLGIRTLLDPKRQEIRSYYSQPYLFRYRIETTGALTLSLDDTNDLYRIRETELSLQQTAWFRNRTWILNYGYRYDWAKIFTKGDLKIPLETGSTSPLFITISRDTRNNVLDASRGLFISSAYEYSPKALGGTLTYQKYYGQLFKYFGLTRPAPTPFSVEPRSRVVYAAALRFGVIGQPPDQIYLPTDAFLAGGGTTIRGYPYNSIGVKGSGQISENTQYTIGGNATIILNNELRFPIWRFLDAATFFDAGNVWQKPSAMSLADLRTSSGVGIRVRNPFVVLRFDYGWIIGRRPGEPVGGFYFSIGQIF